MFRMAMDNRWKIRSQQEEKDCKKECTIVNKGETHDVRRNVHISLGQKIN